MQTTSTQSPLERAIDAAGGLTAFARLINESVQTVSNWKARGGEPPASKCAAIESVTGISRRDLRRDWQKYWPELAGAAA